jgi:hypothetical protein
MSLASYNYKNTTAAVLVKTGPGILNSVIITGGADAATCTIYDNTAGSGSIILKLGAGIGLSAVATDLNIAFSTGCYIALTGTTPSISVSYG